MQENINKINPEKRLFLALLLSVLVLAGWAHFAHEKNVRQMQEQQQQKPKTPPTNKPDQVEKPVSNPPTTNTEPKQITPPPNIGSEKEPEGKEEQTVVDTEKYRMVWTNQGAALSSLKLKNVYHNYVNRKVEDWQKKPENWLEIIPNFSPKNALFAMSLPEKPNVRLDREFWKVTKTDNPNRLIFELEQPDRGMKYSKIFTFSDKDSLIQGEIVMENISEQAQNEQIRFSASTGIDIEANRLTDIAVSLYNYIMAFNENNQRVTVTYSYKESTAENLKVDKSTEWIALINRYFGYVVHVKQPELINSVIARPFIASSKWIENKVLFHESRKETVERESLNTLKFPGWLLQTRPLSIAPKEKISIQFDFRCDTKANLSQLDTKYRILDDYGFFGFISHPLLWILSFFYNIFHNYGIAIICLTLVIKCCLFPLSRKQQISMRDYQNKMKIFQPQLRKLQEKYKNDHQKLNQEVMKLYKDHNINPIPLGGCLPVLLQLPIFIGLYQALSYSILLRQANFLWIEDLSQPDRVCQFGTHVPGLGDYLNILPIVMTIVWIIQQKLAPKPDDPQMAQQQKMFLFMTVIFGFMFYDVASGLVLYWMVMNMFSILEQMIIKKYNPA